MNSPQSIQSPQILAALSKLRKDTPFIPQEDTSLREEISLSSLGGVSSPDSNEKVLTVPSSHHSPGTTSSIEEKVIDLLGVGISQYQVAAAVGVTEARISQLLSNEELAARVVELRYHNLQKHNERDGTYDSIEDQLLEKLEKSLPFLHKPEAILRAITVVNGAKRRGQDSPEISQASKNIVTLVLPKTIASDFTLNINNQVVEAGGQSLVTMQAGELLKNSEAQRAIPTPSTEVKEIGEDNANGEINST